MKYRKKPVVIDAWLWLGENEEYIRDITGCNKLYLGKNSNLFIPTLEGLMEASRGDWIIKGVKGEYYPCKPDIFEATYEPITRKE